MGDLAIAQTLDMVQHYDHAFVLWQRRHLGCQSLAEFGAFHYSIGLFCGLICLCRVWLRARLVTWHVVPPSAAHVVAEDVTGDLVEPWS